LQSLLGKESLMGSDHNIWERKKSCCCGMLQDLIGTVLENILRFFFIYIQSHAEEFSGTDSVDQIICLNHTASGSVYQNHPVFHLGDVILVDKMIGAVHQRAVKRDQITLCQQFIQSHIGNKIL